jgi:hypothetical protein
MNKIVTFNIGLTTKEGAKIYVVAVVNELLSKLRLKLKQVSTSAGTWDGVDSPTLVAVCEVEDADHDLSFITKYAEDIAFTFGQDCVALDYMGSGMLVYQAGFKGERVDFNREYFIP